MQYWTVHIQKRQYLKKLNVLYGRSKFSALLLYFALAHSFDIWLWRKILTTNIISDFISFISLRYQCFSWSCNMMKKLFFPQTLFN